MPQVSDRIQQIHGWRGPCRPEEVILYHPSEITQVLEVPDVVHRRHLYHQCLCVVDGIPTTSINSKTIKVLTPALPFGTGSTTHPWVL